MDSLPITTVAKQQKRKRMKNKVLLFLLVFNVSFGQQKTLSSTDYWQIVQNFHPIVITAHKKRWMAKITLNITRHP
jgi:hypothetical protein